MKAIKLNLVVLFAAILAACITPVQAQQNENTDVRQKVIIKKYTDEDGTEVTEKIVIDGDEVSEIDLEGFDIDVDVNIDGEDGKEQKVIRIRSVGEDGELKVIEWEGDGEIPADLQLKLKEMKVKGLDGLPGNSHHRFYYKTDESKAFLGVIMGEKIKNIDGEESVEGVSDKGVLISEVVTGSAAEAAGILANDVITALDGQQVKTFDDLSQFIKTKKTGDQISISYLRNDQPATANATLKARERKATGFGPSSGHMDFMRGAPFQVRERPCVFIGVYVDNSRTEDGVKQGARINGIIDGTPAEDAELLEDDIITAVNGVAVTTYGELLQERNKYQPGDEVTLSYLRDGTANTVNIKFRVCEESKKEEALVEESDETTEEESAIIDAPAFIPAPVLSLEDFRAFPNPTNGSVTVRFRGETVPTTISIVDVNGREVFREEIMDFNGNYDQHVNLSDASTGTLLLNVQQGDKIFTQKIILNRA